MTLKKNYFGYSILNVEELTRVHQFFKEEETCCLFVDAENSFPKRQECESQYAWDYLSKATTKKWEINFE
jgi:hypothetical protein